MLDFLVNYNIFPIVEMILYIVWENKDELVICLSVARETALLEARRGNYGNYASSVSPLSVWAEGAAGFRSADGESLLLRYREEVYSPQWKRSGTSGFSFNVFSSSRVHGGTTERGG